MSKDDAEFVRYRGYTIDTEFEPMAVDEPPTRPATPAEPDSRRYTEYPGGPHD